MGFRKPLMLAERSEKQARRRRAPSPRDESALEAELTRPTNSSAADDLVASLELVTATTLSSAIFIVVVVTHTSSTIHMEAKHKCN